MEQNTYACYAGITECMARNLAHTAVDEQQSSSSSGGKERINRRQYLKVGGVTLAAAVTGGAAGATSSVSAEATETHWTDFSEAQL